MNDPSPHEVIIVGAGPVGLFLGCCLQQAGIDVQLLEREPAPVQHSRSIGIHPPSLELLARLGLAGALIERGLRIQTGRVYSKRRSLGTLSFTDCPGPFPFVLTIPQHETEKILEAQLLGMNAAALRRDFRVTDIEDSGHSVRVRGQQADGSHHELRALFLVGCDGASSVVREGIGARREGGPYDDCFVMGDFHDDTDCGAEAHIYLDEQGFVESFPLPDRIRRWVLRVPVRVEYPRVDEFRRWVEQRTGARISGKPLGELTSFGVQGYVAKPLCRGRVVLAGDAAHVTSPIGGQGMNIGWLNAWELAETLRRVLRKGADRETEWRRYEWRTRRRARRVIRRAERNMWLGRGGLFPRVRDKLIRLLLNSPARKWLARYFTMRWL